MTASAEVWQRYVEPFVLIVLTLMSAAVLSRGEASRGRAISRVAGVTLLTIACVGVTVRTFQAGVESWSDPAPAPMDANHIGPPPPVVLEAPVKPTGKTFW
jgi:lipopolysaccharide export LptBFGC system permease protein LptF